MLLNDFPERSASFIKVKHMCFQREHLYLEICFKVFLNDLLGIVQIVGEKGHELIIVEAGHCTTQLKRMNASFHNKN